MRSVGIQVDNVTVTYNGKVALHGANLLLVSGSIGGLNEWQRSKSTLFKSIMGFVKPTTGRVLINGCPSDWCKKRTWWLTFLNQRKWTGISVSVWDVVMMSLRVYECTRIPSPTDRRIVAESLEGANDRVPKPPDW